MTAPAPIDPVDLLRELVRIPSVSGSEERAARHLEARARAAGLDVVRDAAAVRITVPPAAGPAPATLLFASHLDTVPAGEGWSRDPFGGELTGGEIVGRGSVDAKGSVAAMVAAAAELAAEAGPLRARVVVLATYGEETRDASMPRALERLGARVDAAVVGEPTGLEPCVAQRGLLVVRLVWRGTQRHAARAGAPADNAIHRAARDLVALEALRWPVEDPLFGAVTVTPTTIAAGIARNATPPRCEALLDIRTTPGTRAGDVVARIERSLDGACVEIVSDRLRPARTPPDSRLLAAIRRLRPDATPFTSPTASDWVFLRDVDAVKLGPGDSRLSHAPDERIPVAQLRAAAELYAALAREYAP